MATINVNGVRREVQAAGDTPLLYVLRNELNLVGPQFGCGIAQCGACSVLLDGKEVRSCITFLSDVTANQEITTLEGLGTPERPHPIQQAFIEEGAAQCGYCLSGVILTAKALLDAKPHATDDEIRDALGGVLCRCFTHTRMLRAIRRYRDGRRA